LRILAEGHYSWKVGAATDLPYQGLVTAVYAVENTDGNGEGIGRRLFGGGVFFPANYAHRHIRSSIHYYAVL